MAFTGVNSSRTLPSSVQGIYFFPYTWFRYGLANEKLTIEDVEKFSKSLQGSVLSYIDEQVKQWVINDKVHLMESFELERNGQYRDLWLSFTGGSSLVTTYWFPSDQLQNIDAPNTKAGFVTVCGLKKLLTSTFNEQKTINNSIISQFAGCGIKMLDSVWYLDVNKIFSIN